MIDLNELAAYDVLDYLERMGLKHLMERFGYNQSDLALALKMSRQTLRKKLRQHGIPTTHLKRVRRQTTLPPSTLRV